MSILRNAVPASLRAPMETSKFAQSLLNRVQRATLIAGPEARAVALAKSRFARLPHEPEDARITGVTRSLNRRLLALNISGTLMRHSLMTKARIA